MKLIRASFQNFRLLRDLDIEFSTDADHRLTVLRAENESGKTTMLTALQWALYGDDALPSKGADYRLHPIDWDSTESIQIPIDVSIEFEVTSMVPAGGGRKVEDRRKYRLIRSTVEHMTGNEWSRSGSTVKLFQITSQGDLPIESPEATIADVLPPDLREVFFTDGDRALSFIEAGLSTSTKRDRVQRAIRSLLGLAVVEQAKRHIRDAATDVNRRARALTNNSDLQEVTKKIEANETFIVNLETDVKSATDQFEELDEKLNEIDKRIGIVLQKGDQEQLGKDLEVCRKATKRLDDQLTQLDQQHSNLFRSPSLARDLLRPILEKGVSLLDGLKEQGKIPSTTLPVLEDRLTLKECICGESLDSSISDGARRRRHIEGLIEKSRQEDEIQKLLTEYYYRSKSFVHDPSRDGQPWIKEYEAYLTQREHVRSQREGEGKRMRSLEAQLDSLGDSDIGQLRETKLLYKQQRDHYLTKKNTCETNLIDRRNERNTLTQKREKLLHEEKKGAQISSELDAVQDIQMVLERAYERISKEELKKVSVEMNTLFLQMIGSDPELNSIIKRSEINEEYDIVVYGLGDRRLNPDQDLNGASRRALTMAFILALTKVSEYEAANIIDTPLGMMAGFVKRSVLRTAVTNSSQIVMFLTSAEIKDCEDIIDEYAGRVITLTNPAHYPKMLANKPPTTVNKVLRCNCNHRQQCQICERRSA